MSVPYSREIIVPVDIWSQHVGLHGVTLTQMWCLLSLLDFTDFSIRSFFFSLLLCLASLPSTISDTHPLWCCSDTCWTCWVIIQGIVLMTPVSPRGALLEVDYPVNFVPVVSIPKPNSQVHFLPTFLFILVHIPWWSYKETVGDHGRGHGEAEMHSILYFLFLKTVSSHYKRHLDEWGTIHPGRSLLALPDCIFLPRLF